MRTINLYFEYDNGYGYEYFCNAEVQLGPNGDAKLRAMDIETQHGEEASYYVHQCCEEKALELALERSLENETSDTTIL